MNAYLQAAIHNLKSVRADLTVAERDRDRYLAASEQNFARFRDVERELAEEKEKSRRLELELKRGRDSVLAEYKASQEFGNLLNEEYDANFPDTFKMCWERIIEELGEKIEGVTLEKFPVPAIPGQDSAMETSQPLLSQDVPMSSPLADDATTPPRGDDLLLTHSSGEGVDGDDPLKDLDL